MSDLNRIREYVDDHPDADPWDVLEALELGHSRINIAAVETVKSAESGGPEGHSPRSNPGENADVRRSRSPPETDTDKTNDRHVPQAAFGAFRDAIAFFTEHLDTDLPADSKYDTPRDYYREVRGWSDETIAAKHLGYAPAGRGDLLDHLRTLGYDDKTILGTGLFYPPKDGREDPYPHFRGRYVLPYLDEDGRVVYAISRSLDEDAGGHPSDHHGEQKYTKAVKAKDYSALEEPIYGLDTVCEGEPILITEGIADAIAAHQAGLPCLSPVTVQFKHGHREALAGIFRDADVPRVYIVNDAEPPSAEFLEDGDAEGWDRLHLEQHGEGLRGAVRTAAHLADAGIAARVAELPRHGTEKVDLDDYLTRWDGDLRPILARAVPAEDHPAHDGTTAKERALEAAGYNHDLEVVEGDGRCSALFSLEIRDVTGLSRDYRGVNPLGHRGDSENYFVLVADRGRWFAYDHKAKVAYNALTWVLVEAGERRVTDPNGPLEDREVFAAWRHAKDRGYIPEDDPIPRRALRYVARTATDWDGELVEHETRDGATFDGLPTDAYNGAVEAVRTDHGVEPGRSPVAGRSDPDAERLAVLPPAVRDLTTVSSAWDWRHAGTETDLTKEAVRDRTTAAIADAYNRGDRVLIEALPTTGKSHGAIKAAAEAEEQITVLTTRGRKEQYDQLREWCRVYGLSAYTLPSFPRDCFTAAGEHGEDWKETVMGWYNRGASPQDIHAHAEYVLGEPLPCQREEGHRCPYAAKWDFDPDDYDVLIGHPSHAYKQKRVTTGRTVVFDEDPSSAFETELSHHLEGAVSRWLETTEAVPYDDYTDLLEGRGDADRRDEALRWFDETDLEDLEANLDVLASPRAHADAPIAVYALLAAEDLGNGFEWTTTPDGGIAARNRKTGTLTVLRPPPLKYASGVVCLDGTPTRKMWELSLGSRLNHCPVLQGDERAEYLTDALNLNLVRTTEYVKPYNSADHVNVREDGALLEAIADKHGEQPAIITTATAEKEYDREAVDELVDDTRHYGNVKGSNQYTDIRLGAVIGSNHYGDDFMKRWGAYAGEAVERDGDGKGAELSYTGIGDRILEHMREHDTLQAVMRFGRDGNGAVVYVHTDTLPDWVPIAGEGRVVDVRSDGERQVIHALEDMGTGRTGEIADHPVVEVGERRVFDILNELADRGDLARKYEGRGYTWSDEGLHAVSHHGEAEFDAVDLEGLGDGEVAEVSRNSIYTWKFRNPNGPHSDDVPEPDTNATGPPGVPADGPGPPPNDID